MSPALQVDSLPAEPQGKPKNTGVGSLSLLQGTFLTQESNQGLLHCRWILYQLPGKPFLKMGTSNLFKMFFMILLKSKNFFETKSPSFHEWPRVKIFCPLSIIYFLIFLSLSQKTPDSPAAFCPWPQGPDFCFAIYL